MIASALANIGQLPALRSGGWFDSLNWDFIIRCSLLGSALILEIVVMTILIRIITENHREKKEQERKHKKRPSKPDDLLGVPLHNGGRFRLFFRNKCHQFTSQTKLNGNLLMIPVFLHLRNYFSNARLHKQDSSSNSVIHPHSVWGYGK